MCRKYWALEACFRFEPNIVEAGYVYRESTMELKYEMGRFITEATGKKQIDSWPEQGLGLTVQRGNALSIVTAVREKYGVTPGHVDCLLNASLSICKPPSFTFGLAVILFSVSQYTLYLIIDTDLTLLVYEGNIYLDHQVLIVYLTFSLSDASKESTGQRKYPSNVQFMVSNRSHGMTLKFI